MAEYTEPDQKSALIAEIADARAGISRSFTNLRREADLRAHFRRSYSSHRMAWLGSAGIAGWVLARLPARKKKVKVYVNKKDEHKVREIAEAGLLTGVVKFLFTLFKPAIMAFATKKLADMANRGRDFER
jgi:hypothetical protein